MTLDPPQVRAAVLATAVAASIAICSYGQTPDDYAFTFDLATGQQQVGNLWFDWWGTTPSKTFDPTVDVNNSALSGSMKVTVEYTGLAEDVCVLLGKFDRIIDGTTYTNVAFDLKVAPGSPVTTNGNYMDLWQVGLVTTNGDVVWLPNVTVPASPGWIHVNLPTDRTDPRMETIEAFLIELWGEDAPDTGTGIFWFDNLILGGEGNPVVSPKAELERPIPGLLLAASMHNEEYQFQSVRTRTSCPWVGSSGGATYSLNVKAFPDAAHSGFELDLLLVPQQGAVSGVDDPDIEWDAPNVMYLQIQNQPDGSATASIMYKTNDPDDDSMFWNYDASQGPVGFLGSVDAPTPLGSWTLTFANDTTGELTAPGGASARFTMPATDTALFTEPVYAYVGIMPNDRGNIGQFAVVGGVEISGTGSGDLREDFSVPLDTTNRWTYVAYDLTGIAGVPSDSVWWLNWTLPATGFTAVEGCASPSGNWIDLYLTNRCTFGDKRRALIPASKLPNPATGFFRVRKQ